MVTLIEGDVFAGSSDLLLNPCNCEPTLYWGTHVSDHIYWNAGSSVRDQRTASGNLQYGDYCLTSGGNLKHSFILHVAVLQARSLDMRYLLRLRKRIDSKTLLRSLDTVYCFLEDSQFVSIDAPRFWGGTNGWSDDEFEETFGRHPALPKMNIYSK